MARDRNLARLVRARMRSTGERYTTARAELTTHVTGRPLPHTPKRHDHARLSAHEPDHLMTGAREVTSALYDALNAADLAAVAALLAPGVTGSLRDLVTSQAEYQGADALLAHLRSRRAIADASYRIDDWSFQEHPQPERFAMAVVRHSAVVDGDRLSAESLHVVRVDDGLIAALTASLPSGEIDGRWLALVA